MFDLTLSFAGMCMLVPDPDNKMLHVLMPVSTTHPHRPRLVYINEKNELKKEDISGMHLELPGVTGTNGFDAHVPPEVFDFGDPLMGSRRVSRNLLEPVDSLPHRVLSTRVRLTAGRHGGTYRRGGFWNFQIAGSLVPRRLPTAVNWVIHDVDATDMCIHDTISKRNFILKPDVTGSIRALIVHVTDEELKQIGPDIPPHRECPPADSQAEHFKLYYPLLTPVGDFHVPEFDMPRSKLERVCPPSPSAQTSSEVPDSSDAAASDTAASGAAAAAAAAAAVAAAATSSGGASSASAAGAGGGALTAHALAADGAGDSTTDENGEQSEHHKYAGAAGGSELTCMVVTAPPG